MKPLVTLIACLLPLTLLAPPPGDFVTQAQLNSALSNYVTKASLSSSNFVTIQSLALSNYVTGNVLHAGVIDHTPGITNQNTSGSTIFYIAGVTVLPGLEGCAGVEVYVDNDGNDSYSYLFRVQDCTPGGNNVVTFVCVFNKGAKYHFESASNGTGFAGINYEKILVLQ